MPDALIAQYYCKASTAAKFMIAAKYRGDMRQYDLWHERYVLYMRKARTLRLALSQDDETPALRCAA